jgi:GNAT superfamily N-acetyltransferase
MNVTVEPSNDWATAAQLRAEMGIDWGDDWDATSPGWRERYAAFFAQRANGDETQLYLARDGEEIAGMAIVSYMQHYRTAVFGTKFAYVNGVFVRGAYRRRGVATALMQAAQRWAKEHGCTAVRLRASAEGAFLYRALGYVPTTEMELRLGKD